MSHVALTWYVWETTHSPQALGLLTFFYTGPVVVGGLLAGILLDRFGPRRIMIIDSLLRGVAFGLIPLLHFTGALRIWHIYSIAGVYGGLMMISLAGSPTTIPSLISEDLLPAANALETIAFTLGGVVGPPIAGGEVIGSVLAGSLRAGMPLGLLIGLAQIASGLSVAGVLLGSRAWIVALSLAFLGFFSAPLTI